MLSIDKISRRWRWLRLKMAGAKVDYRLQSFDDFFRGNATGFECGNLYISQGSKIIVASHRGVSGRLKIANNVYINHYTIIDCHHFITIGNDVKIGPHCYIGDFDHNITWPHNTENDQDKLALPVKIEPHVWLGAGVKVLKGVTIGEGAVVGAGSVITKDIPSKAIVAGIPAKTIRMRDENPVLA